MFFSIFTPTVFGENAQFDLRIFFQMGWFNHHLDVVENQKEIRVQRLRSGTPKPVEGL